MATEELKKRISGLSAISIMKSKQQKMADLRRDIVAATMFLSVYGEVSLSTRLYCVSNNITTPPICKSCDNFAPPNKLNARLGFSKFCSLECSRKSSDIDFDTIKKLKCYDTMYDMRVSRKMSWEDIASELSVSTITAKKYCDNLGIPEVNYSKASSEIVDILGNKELLEKLYVDDRKTIYQIADETGSSPSFVSVWLERHGIETRSPNAYNRHRHNVSGECQEIIDYIKSIYGGELIINDRTILGDGRELDIVIPERGIAIEYNGVWSHLYRPGASTKSLEKGKTYHISKANICREKGYKLFMIWSDDWKTKTDIIKSMLSTKLGLTERKIGARKCDVVAISSSERRAFLDDNHLQGKDRAPISLGLVLGDELVSVMTFGRSRYNKNFEWELSRFAVKKGVSCPGAFSKLLKHFMRFNSGSIISYADFDHSHGEVYIKNGFEFIRQNGPSYWYVAKNSETMQHRFKFRKGIIGKEDPRTEWEIMQSNGYSKIFDCGTIAFGIKNPA